MVNAARLSIDIDVNLGASIPNLDRLADTLLDVAEAQTLVDERMGIRVNVRGLAELTALNSQLGALAPQQALAMGMGMGGGLPGVGSGGSGGGGFDTDDAGRFSLRMSSLHNALADVIPLVLVLVAALPAAVAALAGLATAAIAAAAALTAIGGLGLMGMVMQMEGPAMENLQSIAEDVFEDFQDAFEPLANVLAPTFERALGGLEAFFDELAARGDTLLELRDDAMAFGGFLLEAVPTAIERLAALADAASPIFSAIAQWLEDTDITNAFAQALRRALPALSLIARAIVNILPGLTRLSQGFLNVTAGVLLVLGGIFTLIDALGPLGEMLGFLIGTFAVLLSFISLYGTVMNAAAAITSFFAGTAIADAVSALVALEFAQLRAALASFTLAQALGLVVGLLTAGLGVAAAIGAFNTLNSQINDATSNLNDFGQMSGNMDSSGLGAGSSAVGGETVVYEEYSPTYNAEAGSASESDRVARRMSYREGTATDSAFAP